MIFFRKHEPTHRSLKVIIFNKKIHKFRLLCMCMIMSMLMSVVIILYICHLVPSYQVRKTLSCSMKDLCGQRSEWGTLTSYILTTLCDNKIFICIVINRFITTLPTFRHWTHLGRNKCEFFIVLNPPLDREKKLYLKKLNTARALFERVLKTLFTPRWHTNLSYVTVSNVLWIVWDHRLIYLDC